MPSETERLVREAGRRLALVLPPRVAEMRQFSGVSGKGNELAERARPGMTDSTLIKWANEKPDARSEAGTVARMGEPPATGVRVSWMVPLVARLPRASVSTPCRTSDGSGIPAAGE